MRAEALYHCSKISVHKVACRAARGSTSAEEAAPRLELVLPLSGVFVVQSGAREVVATPGRVLAMAPGAGYRVRHPVHGGDDCLAITLEGIEVEHLASATTGDVADLALRGLASVDALARDEAAWALAGRALAAALRQPLPAASPPHRRLARRAEELIASRLCEPLRLAELAELLGVSPFHLARVFRASTGVSLHGYRLRLRVRLALARILGGERDLARLALELGFADHAHLTSTLRRRLGFPPSALRGRRASTIFKAALRRLEHDPLYERMA